MTFFKFYALIIAFNFLKGLTFDKKRPERKDLDWEDITIKFAVHFIIVFITYKLLQYAGPDFIELIKNLI